MTHHRVNHQSAPIAGYTDRLSARPGERILVHASATEPECAVRVLRVGHDGSQPAHIPVDIPLPATVHVPHQTLDLGSYGLVSNPPALNNAVTFTAWIWPTSLPADSAGIITQGVPDGGPFAALSLLSDGRAAFDVSTVDGLVSVRSVTRLHLRRWYQLVGGYDPAEGARLTVHARDPLVDEYPMTAAALPLGALVTGSPSLLLAAFRTTRGEITGNLDGKIDSPAVFDRLVDGVEQAGARARWDLSHDIPGDRVIDVVDGHDGRLHNLPMRGVTGHDWAGDVLDWRYAERGYGAVHFHSDDIEDASWDPVLTLDLPLDLPSGCYAVELSTPDAVERLPFFVRPRAVHAPMALLIPTLSYLAYALDHLRMPMAAEDPAEVAARFARDNGLHSLYDRHADGSGVCLASLRRPLFGMREDHVFRYNGSPHQYSEDIQLVGWLQRQGFEFDVLTDHDLHADGSAALAGYRAVVTGSHPEYWTSAMLDAAHEHLAGGGNLAYLGGNGAYWVTAIAPNRPHVAELRRGYAGVRTWECEPGELHLASTGEPGGLWAERGRSPHRLFGIGTSAAGMSPGGTYELLVDDPVLAGLDSPLGGFGTVLGAAASFETDGIDPLLGSPPGITLLGRAMLGESYMSADTGPAVPHPLSDPVDRRRADLTLLRTAGGGRVFATGSIGWCGALSHKGDDNDVSRLTATILHSFCEGTVTDATGS
nr:N,N-dimethylformamidase beta subunit family domain-containing protein [Kibdelosporangium sp. MJ126-NF4]CTQ88653.1 Large subunit of N,N-dimethylformamidase [Kibdelosporangium sp. MJ126-NF4]